MAEKHSSPINFHCVVLIVIVIVFKLRFQAEKILFLCAVFIKQRIGEHFYRQQTLSAMNFRKFTRFRCCVMKASCCCQSSAVNGLSSTDHIIFNFFNSFILNTDGKVWKLLLICIFRNSKIWRFSKNYLKTKLQQTTN